MLPLLGSLALFLAWIARLWPIRAQRSRFRATALNVAIDCYLFNDRETEAGQLAYEYLNLAEEMYGQSPEGEQGATIVIRRAQLGALMWRTADSDLGAQHVDAAVGWFRSHRPEPTMVWGACVMNLGVELLQIKRYADAAEWLERAIDLRRRTPKITPYEIAQGFNNLGIALQHLERYDEAEAAGRQALELHGRVCPDGRGVAKSLCNLAETLLKAGRLEESEQHAVRAAELARMDPEVRGAIADTLADVFEAKGKLPEALAARWRAIRELTAQQKLGVVIEYTGKQAALLDRMGRTDEAAECREYAAHIRRRSHFQFAGMNQDANH